MKSEISERATGSEQAPLGRFQMVEEMDIQPVLGEEEMEVETRWRRRRRWRRRWRWWRWRTRVSQRRMGQLEKRMAEEKGAGKPCLLWKQAVPVPWPLSQLVLAPGKLELKRWGKNVWVFGRSVGPFFLKNGIKANNFHDWFFYKKYRYIISVIMYCGSSPTDTANHLMILCNYTFSLSYFKRGHVCGAGTVALYIICLLDPCHFFLKRFQPLYLDSGNNFITYMSIYSFFRYILCK